VFLFVDQGIEEVPCGTRFF